MHGKRHSHGNHIHLVIISPVQEIYAVFGYSEAFVRKIVQGTSRNLDAHNMIRSVFCYPVLSVGAVSYNITYFVKLHVFEFQSLHPVCVLSDKYTTDFFGCIDQNAKGFDVGVLPTLIEF